MGRYAIQLTEGDSAAVADFYLKYAYTWTTAAKRGTPVLQADVTKIYFYCKTSESDASPWLALSTADAAEIAWVTGPGATDGHIRVYFGEETEGQAGGNQPYELRVRFTNGQLLTWVRDVLDIEESIVDDPVSSSVSSSPSSSPSPAP